MHVQESGIMGQQGFWDWENRHDKLDKKKPLLQRLNALVPWHEFSPILAKIHQKERKSNAGRKPTDDILMFKMLILQQLYNISDQELEYQINDRFSFMKFLGLGIEDSVPDGTTVWMFRDNLKKEGLITELFEKFEHYLQAQGYQAKEGQIVDATLVPVPKQRNTREQNETIKQGEVPQEWKGNRRILSQKDTEARWTQKNGQNHFGYKNHINIDVKYGFIREYRVTDSAVHDSQMLGNLLDEDNDCDQLWGDSAYRSEKIEWVLEKIGFKSQIHERGYRNDPLTENQKEENREKSKTRAKVEHVFGSWMMEMGGKLIRCIGKERAEVMIGLKNLVYNIKKYIFWETQRKTGEVCQS